MKDRIEQIRAHLIGIDKILCTLEEDVEKPKAKVEIKLSGEKGPFEDMDELIEKFSKDLEEMLNDTTEKREG